MSVVVLVLLLFFGFFWGGRGAIVIQKIFLTILGFTTRNNKYININNKSIHQLARKSQLISTQKEEKHIMLLWQVCLVCQVYSANPDHISRFYKPPVLTKIYQPPPLLFSQYKRPSLGNWTIWTVHDQDVIQSKRTMSTSRLISYV